MTFWEGLLPASPREGPSFFLELGCLPSEPSGFVAGWKESGPPPPTRALLLTLIPGFTYCHQTNSFLESKAERSSSLPRVCCRGWNAPGAQYKPSPSG